MEVNGRLEERKSSVDSKKLSPRLKGKNQPHIFRKLFVQTTQPTYTARPINKPGTPEKFISIAFRGRSQFPPPDRNLFSPRDRAKFGRGARRVPVKGSLRRVS